jgi:hypothetical protein
MRPMDRRFSSVLATAVAFLMMALSACSGGSSNPTEPPAPSPRPEPPAAPAPACANPAPLEGQYNPAAPGYIILFQEGVKAPEVAQSLARKHGFTPSHIYETLPGFASQDMTGEVAARIRCEPTVRLVEYNGIAYPH